MVCLHIIRILFIRKLLFYGDDDVDRPPDKCA